MAKNKRSKRPGKIMHQQASPLFVEGIAQAIAIHLARNYAKTVEESHSGSPSLPGYKLRQITDWMAEHFAEDLNLDRLAAQVGLSKFHFHRLFKSVTGVTPARYQINLRINLARQLASRNEEERCRCCPGCWLRKPQPFPKALPQRTRLVPERLPSAALTPLARLESISFVSVRSTFHGLSP